MTEVLVEFRKNIRAKRENDFGLENALAGYCRRRWQDKTIPNVMHEWGLSESEAAKVVYAQASKNTLNKILHHKRGGPLLFVELVCDVAGTSLEHIIKTKSERAAHERRQLEAEERHWKTLAAGLAGDGGDAGGLDQPAWGRRASDARVGQG